MLIKKEDEHATFSDYIRQCCIFLKKFSTFILFSNENIEKWWNEDLNFHKVLSFSIRYNKIQNLSLTLPCWILSYHWTTSPRDIFVLKSATYNIIRRDSFLRVMIHSFLLHMIHTSTERKVNVNLLTESELFS